MKTLLTSFLFLIYISLAHAAPTVTARGTGGDNSSTASTTVTPTGTIPVGSMGMLLFTGDNANATAVNFPTTITDSVGNIWYKRGYSVPAGGGANANVETGMYVAQITVAFTTSNSLVLTYTAANVTAKSWVLWQVTPGTGGNIIVVDNTSNSASFTNLVGGAFAASGAPSVTSISSISTDNIVIGMCVAESGDTFIADADTTNGNWSTAQKTGFGSGATGISIISQYKVVTAAGAQQWNPTLTAADGSIQFLALSENSPFARGSYSNITSLAGTAFSPGAPMAVGTMGVYCIAYDNAGLNGDTAVLPSSFTDDMGNTWTLRMTQIHDPGAASAGSEMGIYTAPITTLLRPIDHTDFSNTGGTAVVARAMAMWCVAPAAAGTLSFASSGSAAGSTTASPTVTTSSIPSGDVVIGMGAAEGLDSWVADGDSTNGAWSLMQSRNTTGGIATMSISSQYKITTSTATQTYNPTLTSTDVQVGWVSIHETLTTTTNSTGFFLLVP